MLSRAKRLIRRAVFRKKTAQNSNAAVIEYGKFSDQPMIVDDEKNNY